MFRLSIHGLIFKQQICRRSILKNGLEKLSTHKMLGIFAIDKHDFCDFKK